MKFKDFAPMWHHAIELFRTQQIDEYKKYLNDYCLNIGKVSRCILGEAHHWTASYGIEEDSHRCEICRKTGWIFFRNFTFNDGLDKIRDLDKFDRDMEEFEKHFCQVHGDSTNE